MFLFGGFHLLLLGVEGFRGLLAEFSRVQVSCPAKLTKSGIFPFRPGPFNQKGQIPILSVSEQRELKST